MNIRCGKCGKVSPPGARCSWCHEPLADPNRARRTDPETAHNAARRSSSTRSAKDQKILDDLKEHAVDGGTTLEIAYRTDLVHNNMSSRMVPLEKLGLVHRILLVAPNKYQSRVSDVPPHMATKSASQIWYYGPAQPGQVELRF